MSVEIISPRWLFGRMDRFPISRRRVFRIVLFLGCVFIKAVSIELRPNPAEQKTLPKPFCARPFDYRDNQGYTRGFVLLAIDFVLHCRRGASLPTLLFSDNEVGTEKLWKKVKGILFGRRKYLGTTSTDNLLKTSLHYNIYFCIYQPKNIVCVSYIWIDKWKPEAINRKLRWITARKREDVIYCYY